MFGSQQPEAEQVAGNLIRQELADAAFEAAGIDFSPVISVQGAKGFECHKAEGRACAISSGGSRTAPTTPKSAIPKNPFPTGRKFKKYIGQNAPVLSEFLAFSLDFWPFHARLESGGLAWSKIAQKGEAAGSGRRKAEGGKAVGSKQ